MRVRFAHCWQNDSRRSLNPKPPHAGSVCHEPTECYDSMCEVQRKASSGKALLLFLVTCMHDAMQATCMLCAVWRTRDTVICGTEWFLVHDWTFWKLCERTRNPETLPDLEQLIYKGMELPLIKENEKRFEWESIREYRKKKRVPSTSLCRQLWPCHRHLWTSWGCSLLDQDLL